MKALLIAMLAPSLLAETFSSWAAAEFESNEMTNPAISAPSADPDRDGMSNLLEYALGTDPLFSDAKEGNPTVTFANGKIQLEYKRDTNKSDITVVLLVSSNLNMWTTANSELISSKKGLEKRRVTLPIKSRAYFKLQVVQ